MAKKERILWMDGLKGIACFLIFAHHFFLIFYPAIHYGESVGTRFYNYDVLLSQSPLSVFLNGNFFVTMFCLISGMVIGSQVMMLQNEKSRVGEIVVKRYFRLALPIFPLAIAVYIMLRCGVFSGYEVSLITGSPWAANMYLTPITLGKTLKSCFIDTIFFGDSTIATSLWMLSKLFYGSMLAVILGAVAWKAERRAWVVFSLLAAVLFGRGDLRLAFVLGVLMSWLQINRPQFFKKGVGVALLVVGIVLGGYPTEVDPTNAYRVLSSFNAVDIHMIGACFVLYGAMGIESVQRFLSLPIFVKLGSISYSVYLLHATIILSFSTWVFLNAINYFSYSRAVLISFAASVLVVLLVSLFYNRTVEKLCAKIQKKLTDWIFA